MGLANFSKLARNNRENFITRIALVGDQTPQPAPLDADFEHLRTPVAQWLAQVQAIVPSDNAFYTLVPGIDAHTIRHYTKLDEDTQVPPELLNFYKLVNVKQNAVTSAFFFEVAGVHFELLAFKRIGEAWQDLDNLCAGELDEEQAQGYDARVQADDYASAGWIPFAHDHEGNYLLYDTEPSDSGRHGQIIALDNEGWTREVVADSLTDLIEAATRTLQSGDTRAFEFVLREG